VEEQLKVRLNPREMFAEHDKGRYVLDPVEVGGDTTRCCSSATNLGESAQEEA
jgi:hypothetical protein